MLSVQSQPASLLKLNTVQKINTPAAVAPASVKKNNTVKTSQTSIQANTNLQASNDVVTQPKTIAETLAYFIKTPKASPISVRDTTANINKYLNNLVSLGSKITTIEDSSATDSVSTALNITDAQFSTVQSTLAKITNLYQLSVAGIPVSRINTINSDSHVMQFTVADSSMNIANSFDLLNAKTKLTSIVQTGVKAPLVVSQSQYAVATTTLAKITGGIYTLDLKDVTTAQMNSVLSDRKVVSISIKDSATTIHGQLDSLQKLGTKVKSINITADNKTPFVMSLAQLGSYSSLLSKVNNNDYTLSIEDSAKNISAKFDYLIGLGEKLTSVKQLDTSANLTLNATQATTASNLFAKFAPTDYNISISDSCANIGNKIQSLDLIKTHIANIKQTGIKSALNVSADIATITSETLSKIDAGQYTLAVNEASIDDLTTLSDNSKVASISLSLTGTEMAALTESISRKVKSINIAESSITQALSSLNDPRVKSISILADAANINPTTLSELSLKDKNSVIKTVKSIGSSRNLELSADQYKVITKDLMKKLSGFAITLNLTGTKLNGGNGPTVDTYNMYKTISNADGTYSIQQYNGKGLYINYLSQVSGVNFLKYSDKSVFLDSGSSQINALLYGGTNRWMQNGNNAGGSTTQIADDVYALSDSSSKHEIKYKFISSASTLQSPNDKVGFQEMTAIQKTRVQAALAYISSLINIQFVESNEVGPADINFGTNNQGNVSSGYATGSNSKMGTVNLFLNNSGSSTAANADLTQGGYGWETLIHEIGHTLGLKHPGNYNAGGGGAVGPYLTANVDNRRNTVMSYNNPGDSFNWKQAGSTYSGTAINPLTYMPLDITALQFLYGVAGDQVPLAAYQTTSFTPSWMGVQTLEGQSLNLNLSGLSSANIVDLRPNAFSSVNILPATLNAGIGGTNKQTFFNFNNVGLSSRASVTTVTGGSGNDVVFAGFSSAVIDAGSGNDKLYLNGKESDWTPSGTMFSRTLNNIAVNITTSGFETIAYYDANTVSRTHSRVDLVA